MVPRDLQQNEKEDATHRVLEFLERVVVHTTNRTSARIIFVFINYVRVAEVTRFLVGRDGPRGGRASPPAVGE